MQSNIQKPKQHYEQSSYNNLERFISYYYQIESILGCGSKRILEIGVGNKLSSEYLRGVGIEVTTCDFDAELKPDIVADVRDIPVPDKSYDAIAAFQILEHIPFSEFGKALKEFARISRKHVLISLPYRSTCFEFIFKFPGIRTLLKRHFIDLTLRIPLRFGGFEKSGQHYWEIDSGRYKLKEIQKEIEKHFVIKKSFSPVLNKFHYFFVLEVL